MQKIVVLTTYKGDVQIFRALKAGAQGYVLKNTIHKELTETIRAVHAPGRVGLFLRRRQKEPLWTVRFSY